MIAFGHPQFQDRHTDGLLPPSCGPNRPTTHAVGGRGPSLYHPSHHPLARRQRLPQPQLLVLVTLGPGRRQVGLDGGDGLGRVTANPIPPALSFEPDNCTAWTCLPHNPKAPNAAGTL